MAFPEKIKNIFVINTCEHQHLKNPSKSNFQKNVIIEDIKGYTISFFKAGKWISKNITANNEISSKFHKTIDIVVASLLVK